MTFTIIDESAVDPEESEYTLRVDDVQLDPNDPNGDVYLYLLSFKLGDAQEWSPACADGYGDPVEAIALQNHWDAETGERVDDPDTFTFACRDGAIGKCVAFGYRPWATAGSTSLADYHQACTRMVRADYCGDGVPHTLNGTTIDIADTLNPPIQTFASHWPVEAEWGPDGAVCMTQHLRAKLLGEGVSIPCADALDDLEDCGDAPGGRAELIDRYSDDDD